MSDEKTQNYQNHVKVDPWFLFLMLPVGAIWVGFAFYQLIRNPNLGNAAALVLAFTITVAFIKTRVNALKVQDRVIRLEETLRMQRVLPEVLKERIGHLSEAQFVALRFASDEELPGLVDKTLANRWKSKEIKQAIVSWRPDTFRV